MDKLDFAHDDFFKHKIKESCNTVYSAYLLQYKDVSNNNLLSFDTFINQIGLGNLTNEVRIKYFKVSYIHRWRVSNYSNLPNYIVVLYKLSSFLCRVENFIRKWI